MKNLFYSFRNIITFFVIIIVSILTGSFIVYQTVFFNSEIEKRISTQLDDASYKTFDILNKKLTSMKGILKIMIKDEILAKHIKENNPSLILERIDYYIPILDMVNIEILDNKENYYTTTRTEHSYRFTKDEITNALSTLTQDNTVIFYTRENELCVKLLQHDIGELGPGFYGIVSMGFSFNNGNTYSDYLKGVSDTDVFIINNNSVISSTFINESSFERINSINIPQKYMTEAIENEESYIKEIKINGDPYSVKLCKIKLNRGNSTGIIGFAVSRADITKVIRQTIFMILIATLVIFISIIIFSFILSNRITRPIKNLTDAANMNASGSFTTVENCSNNEIGNFTHHFNKMVTELKNVQENLENIIKIRTKDLQDTNKKLHAAYDEKLSELKIAQRIQDALIPKEFNSIKKAEIKCLYIPMEDLGGDLYDVYKINEDKFAIVILDVTGHGVPASLITTMAKISFSTNTTKSDNPEEIVARVNDEVCYALGENTDYFTAFFCIIDISKMELRYVNAGHNDVYIKKSSDEIVALKANGPMVGALKGISYKSETVPISNGDRIVLYTDGIVEAKNSDNKLYDNTRFVNFIIKHKGCPDDFITDLQKDLNDFKNKTPFSDDISLLVVDIK